MSRHFFLKALSKISNRNASKFNKYSFSPFFQKFLYGQNGVSVNFQQNQFYSAARRFFSNARRSKCPPEKRSAELSAERKLHSDESLKSLLRAERIRNANIVLTGLIGTNAAVYLLWQVASPEFMVKNFMISVENFTSGRFYTLITSAFSHKEILHLISTMVGVFFFGRPIGRALGPGYLLRLYLSGAVAGSISFMVYHASIAPLFPGKQSEGIDLSRIPGLGANAAKNAIVMLYIFLCPHKIIYIDFVLPVPAALLGVFFIGSDLLKALQGNGTTAPLAGVAVAAIAWAQIMGKLRPPRRF